MPGFLDWIARVLSDDQPPPLSPEPVPTALAPDDPRIPAATRPGVARLLTILADLDARTAHEPLLAAARAEVQQMRDSHLPQLVASYADIPAAHRAEIFRRTGRSASYTLTEGVDRMIARAEALSHSLAQENLDSFSDNLRFIETRYGRPDPPR